MKMKHLFHILAIVSFASCQHYAEEAKSGIDDGCSVYVTAQTDDFSTKSAFTWSDSDIKDLQVIVSDEDGSLVENIYSKSATGIYFRGDAGRKYTFRAVANIGHEISGSSLSELMNSSLSVDFNSIQSHGVPMVNVDGVEHEMKGGDASLTIPLKRLMARVDFKIDCSLLKHADLENGFQVKSLKLFNATTSMKPLSSDGIKKEKGSQTGSFDYASTSDVSTLNRGGSISLYAMENMQGDLLPSNVDPWKKVPEMIDNEEVCSYLEVTASYMAQGLSSEDIKYRMYLGSNATSNFDVCRNTAYSITLFPTEDEIDGHRGSWKIATGEWSDARSLKFNPSAIEVESGSTNSAKVVMTPEPFEVSFSHTDWLESMGCTFAYDDGKVSISCSKEPEADVTDYIRATSWDGRLSDDLMVTVAKSTNPVVDIYLKGQSKDGIYISDHAIVMEAGKGALTTDLGITYVFKDGTEHTVTSLEDEMYKNTKVTFNDLSKKGCFYFEYYGKTLRCAATNINNEKGLMHFSYNDEEGPYEGDVTLSSITRLFDYFYTNRSHLIKVGSYSYVTLRAHYKDGYSFQPSKTAFDYVYLDIPSQYSDIAESFTINASLAIKGLSVGTCPATLRFKTPAWSESGFPPNKEYSLQTTITVYDVGYLVLEPDYKEIKIGDSYELKAKSYPDWNSDKFYYVNPNYVSSDTSIAEVDANGTVTGLKEGTSIITAKFYGSESNYETFTASAIVKVLKDDVTTYSVEIIPATVSMMIGDKKNVQAVLKKFVNGTQEEETDITQNCQWNISDDTVAAVFFGEISAKSEGKATVTAKYDGLSGSAEISVSSTAPEISYMYELVIPESVSMGPGTTAELKAFLMKHTLVDGKESGAAEKTDVTTKCTWSSSDTDVVEVGAHDGKLSAHTAGTSKVTAVYKDETTGELKSNECSVRVSDNSGLGVTISWGNTGGEINIGF